MPGPAGKQVTVEPAAREDAAKARGSLRRKAPAPERWLKTAVPGATISCKFWPPLLFYG